VNNSFGDKLRISIFGASHSEEVGIVMEGVPAGIALSVDDFRSDIDRRRPSIQGETQRREADIPQLEGLDAEGVTTGDALRISFLNGDTRSKDYSHLERQPRPSHADLVQRRKWGEEYNLAGGGIASGRMTVALVAAGVLAKKILDSATFNTRLVEVGGVKDSARFEDVIASAQRDGDSVGGVVECCVSGVEALLGEPFFESAESIIAHLLFSVPAVKGVEFGDGFEGARKRGSERNDMIIKAEGKTLTNNEGGINGGITNGNDIVVRVAIKPTPSIAREQQTFDFESGRVAPLTIGGRHDACIARRAQVVVEAVVALALADLKLRK
jgi:chorismate synthase